MSAHALLRAVGLAAVDRREAVTMAHLRRARVRVRARARARMRLRVTLIRTQPRALVLTLLLRSRRTAPELAAARPAVRWSTYTWGALSVTSAVPAVEVAAEAEAEAEGAGRQARWMPG